MLTTRQMTTNLFGVRHVCGCVRAMQVNSDEKSAKSDRAQRQGQPLLIRRARAITSSRALDTDVRTPRGSAWHCGRRGWDIALTCWHPRAYSSARLWQCALMRKSLYCSLCLRPATCSMQRQSSSCADVVHRACPSLPFACGQPWEGGSGVKQACVDREGGCQLQHE